ncbi:hypothetical protein [Paraburkholderia adhaesiva]|uniref:hypothetical protein n=1 Tax=Paraburkholderia adhaesiva TaxID=2883244 RepID=UPI001F3395A9|nr:hypothetical protein [Paraburkholderia adhaesiva]
MKRLAALALFVIAGCVTAIAVVRIVGAFVHNPGCGLDCASPDLSAALLSGFVTVLAFPIIGYIFTRRERLTARRALVVLVALVVAAILAATCRYVFELHSQYIEAEAARPVQPDFDFMYMAIATRDVQTYTNAENGVLKPQSVVPQWQRCVIDGASCDKQPRQAHMFCKSGVVYVNEPDWKAFSLIPKENLKDSIPMKSMNLCAPGNIPDQ